MCWMNFHNSILCCGPLYARLMSLLFCFYFASILWPLFCVYLLSLSGYHAEGYHASSLPPRAMTPAVYTSRLSRHSIFLLLGCHTRAITLHHTRTSGYHTRHSSSYFVVYLSPAITPPVLHLHHHRAPHVPTYSTLLVARTCNEVVPAHKEFLRADIRPYL